MFHIVLYEPEIPPNTGNIMRLCANTNTTLHLIHPLAFELDDKKLRRAGLDYRDFSSIKEHHNLEDFLHTVKPTHLYACSTKGDACYSDINYEPGDALLFGPETRGLPQYIREHPQCSGVLRLPMVKDSRSLNLSNAAAIFLYEAWRQRGFAGSNAGITTSSDQSSNNNE